MNNICPEIDQEKMEITFSVASALPCKRYDEQEEQFYYERLVITEEAINLDRLNHGASVLRNHDPDSVLGKTIRAWVADGRLYVRAKFRENDPESAAIFRDICNGTLPNVSIGYYPDVVVPVEDNGIAYRDLTRWTAFEVSVAVGIPADPTVGFYRSLNIGEPKMAKREIPAEETEKNQAATCPDCAKCRLKTVPVPAEEDPEEELEEDPEVKTAEVPAELPEGDPEQKTTEEKTSDQELDVKVQRSISRAFQKMITSDVIRSINIPKKRNSMNQTNYSLARAFQSLVNPKVDASYERGISDELFRSAGFAPSNSWMMVRADGDFTSAANSGKGLVGTEHRPDLFIHALRTRMGVKNATVLSGLQGNQEIPAETGTATVGVGKLNSTSPGANLSVGSVLLTPKKFSAFVTVGEDLLAQGNPDAIAFVMDSLSAQIARKIDSSILTGISDPSIAGVNGTAGVQSHVIADLEDIAWGDIMAMYGKIADYEIEENDLAWVTKGVTKAALMAQSKDQGSGRFLCEDNKMAGYDVNICGGLTAEDLYLGAWRNVIVGQWGGLQIKIDDVSGIKEGSVTIVAKLLADVAITNPKSFVKRVASV